MLQFAVLLVSLNDEDRFFIESLYRRYRDYMYKTASAILQNPHDAEDAVMDVMCKIIKYITKFDGASDTQIQNQIVIGIRIVHSEELMFLFLRSIARQVRSNGF